MESNENRVFWTLGARPREGTRGLPPQRRRVAILFAGVALLALFLGLSEVPFPVAEHTQVDVILVGRIPTPQLTNVCLALADHLVHRPRVRSVSLCLDPIARQRLRGEREDLLTEYDPRGEPWSATEVIENICRRSHSSPRVVLWINPEGHSDLQRWSDLAEDSLRNHVSIGAIVPPRESLPGAWPVLPSRSVSVANEDCLWGDTFCVMLRNLDLLHPKSPEATTVAQLQLQAFADESRHPDFVGLHRDALRRSLPPDWIVSEEAGARVKIQLASLKKLHSDYLTRERVRDASAQRLNLMWHPSMRENLLSSRTECLQVALRHEGQTVSEELLFPDRNVPRTLYISLASLLNNERRFFPSLPRDPDVGDHRRQARLCWNLTWSRATPGLTVVWPKHRQRDLPLPYDSEEEPAERFAALLESGAILAELPQSVEQLREYRAIVLDASVPEGLGQDLGLTGKTVSASGTSLFEWESGQVEYVGGFFQPEKNGESSLSIPADNQRQFLEALQGYFEEGGTVMMLGGDRSCWEPPPVLPEAQISNFRVLLERFDPTLVKASDGSELFGTDPTPPRRIIFAYDDTESAARGDLPDGVFPTLPPLSPSRSTLRVPLDQEFYYAAQLWTYLGLAPSRRTVSDKEIELVVLSNRDLGEVAAARQQIASESGAGRDPEFQSLLPRVLLNSKTDFAVNLLQGLVREFNHPSLAMEIQGRSAFRRSYPATDEATEAAFQHPFPPQTSSSIVWRNRYRTLLRNENEIAIGDFQNLATAPLSKNVSLIDAMEWQHLEQYLHHDVQRPASRDDPLVVAILDGEDPGNAERVRWPLLLSPEDKRESSPTTPFISVTTPRRRFQPRSGQHFLFLRNSSKEPTLSATLAPYRTREKGRRLFEDFDAWWAMELGLAGHPQNDHWSPLLTQGRGRFHDLMTITLARDIQQLRCQPTEATLDQSEISAEDSDMLQRIAHQRLQLSSTPQVSLFPDQPPGSPWKTLVRTTSNRPVVSVARSPTKHDSLKRGTILLGFWDPQYETRMYHSRGKRFENWRDYSSTVLSSAPKTFGFRSKGVELRRVAGFGSDPRFILTPRSVDTRTVPPLLSALPEQSPSRVKIRVRLRPRLGLTQESIPLILRASSDEPGLYNLEFAVGLDDSAERSIELPPSGQEVQLQRETLLELASRFGSSTNREQVFPHAVPMLFEFVVQFENGDAEPVSVFAPVLPVEVRQQYFFGAMAWADPSTQTIDLLLEMYARHPTHRLEVLDRYAFRLIPRRGSPTIPVEASHVRLLDFEGNELPLPRTDSLLPEQLIFHLPETWKHRGRSLWLEVSVPGERSESYALFVPPFSGQGTEERLAPSLAPAERGRPHPKPSELVLDTLTLRTMPRFLRERLRLQPVSEREWSAAHRGVIVVPCTRGEQPIVLEFAQRFLELRSESTHHRGWFLTSLICWCLALMYIAWQRLRRGVLRRM